MHKPLSICLTSLLILSLAGCNQQKVRPYQVKSMIKSDIDMVTDAHMEEMSKLAKKLLVKLYKLNPKELTKAPAGMSVDKRIKQLFTAPYTVRFAELGDYYGIKAVPLAFNEDFKGDRVFAFMVGVTGMIHASYNFQTEFFMLDEIDQQKVYNCARNLERVAWRLNHQKDTDGNLYILSNNIDEESGDLNLSFERLFGKMIATQDMMARIASDKNNRAVNQVLHGVASTTLLPI